MSTRFKGIFKGIARDIKLIFSPKYRLELTIGVMIAIPSLLITVLLAIFIDDPTDKYFYALLTFGFFIVLILLAILFNVKRIFDRTFGHVSALLEEVYGPIMHTNEYLRRRRQFTREKLDLCRTLVHTALPNIIDNICDSNPATTTLHVFVGDLAPQ